MYIILRIIDRFAPLQLYLPARTRVYIHTYTRIHDVHMHCIFPHPTSKLCRNGDLALLFEHIYTCIISIIHVLYVHMYTLCTRYLCRSLLAKMHFEWGLYVRFSFSLPFDNNIRVNVSYDIHIIHVHALVLTHAPRPHSCTDLVWSMCPELQALVEVGYLSNDALLTKACHVCAWCGRAMPL